MEFNHLYELSDITMWEKLANQLRDDFAIIIEPEKRTGQHYYDTFDWRLYGKKLALVYINNQLVLKQVDTEFVQRRQEIKTMPVFREDFPEGSLKQRIAPILDIRALMLQTEIHSHNQVVRILNEDEKTVVRLNLQTDFLPDVDEPITRWLIVNPVRGYPTEAETVSDWLHTHDVRPANRSRFRALMEAAGRQPGGYTSKITVELDPAQRADAATKILLKSLLSTIRINEIGIKQDIDTEFLHDFRVAIRRTRSALSQIKNVLPPEAVVRFKRDFSELGKMTNRLRDLDVYLLEAPTYRAMLPTSLRSDIEPMFDFLQEERRKELARTRRSLNSKRYATILADWELFLNAPANSDNPASKAAEPIIDVARNRIYKTYNRIVKKGNQIHDSSPDTDLHALRIECKKLRYLMEFFASLFPKKKIGRLIKQLKRLQDNLGRFQDLSVQEEHLEDFVEQLPLQDRKTKREILAIGSLIGTLDREKTAVRAAFADTFAHFASEKNQHQFMELFVEEA